MLIVQKYGGATLATPEKIKAVAQRISDLKKSGKNIVAVVSAMGQTTNQLIHLAHQVSANPSLRELDMLLSVGERTSMALLTMALNDLHCPAISFTGSQAGILTDESHINANIIDVKAFRVSEALQQNKVVILAGFQGVSALTKEITTLGRGGSDTSAVAMASHLKADHCEILKDVDSVFTADPKLISQALPLRFLNFDQLLEMTLLGAKVLHYKSVEMAKAKNVKLYVGPAADPNSEGTWIDSTYLNQKNSPLAVHTKNFLTLDSSDYLTDLEKKYALKNLNLCSASLTMSQAMTTEIKNHIAQKFKTENIKIVDQAETDLSLNLILNQDQKNQALSVLHSLIAR